MTREDHLAFCQQCLLRKFNLKKGIVCSLTGEHGAFDPTCPDYQEDEKEKKAIEKKEAEIQQQELEEETLGFSSVGIKDPTIAGFIALAIAAAWFVAGIIYLDRIFFYPIFLVVIGIWAIAKGQKRKKKS